jgi:hypothetical protein
MWLIDKSVDGTVGQVQNCYFYQTSPPNSKERERKMSKRKPLKQLDAVWTKWGTLAVVAEVNDRGDVSLVLPETSTQRTAWYSPKELELIGPLGKLVDKALN